jgi:BTB/POZ domain-containing protein 17
MEPEVTEIEIEDQQSVLLKVAGLYASHLLSDISLVVGENCYPAHRVILSASSEVFQCMLLNPQWQESKEVRRYLDLRIRSTDEFSSF